MLGAEENAMEFKVGGFFMLGIMLLTGGLQLQGTENTLIHITIYYEAFTNRPFPSSPGPLYQNEVRCSTFDMEMIINTHANKTHFHKKS